MFPLNIPGAVGGAVLFSNLFSKKPRPVELLVKGDDTHAKWYRVTPPSQTYPVSINYLYHNVRKNNNLVVYLHGLGSSETTWTTPDFFSTEKWLDVQLALGDDEPDCLSINLNPMFFPMYMLHPKDRYYYPKHYTVKDFMFILKHIMERHSINPAKIILIGSSMGGFNAFQLYTAYPEMWSKVILHVPMTPLGDMWNFFDFKLLSAPIVRMHFTQQEWPSCNPHNMITEPALKVPIQIHISKKDEFNLYDGGKALALKMLEYGHYVFLVENPGGHKDLGVDEAVNFIKN